MSMLENNLRFPQPEPKTMIIINTIEMTMPITEAISAKTMEGISSLLYLYANTNGAITIGSKHRIIGRKRPMNTKKPTFMNSPTMVNVKTKESNIALTTIKTLVLP